MNQIISAGVAVAVILGAYQLVRQSGVKSERARVEKNESKLNAKIRKAQRAVAGAPAASVLDRWSRD